MNKFADASKIIASLARCCGHWHKDGMMTPMPRIAEEKLAAALRANLLKRKRQATERAAQPPRKD